MFYFLVMGLLLGVSAGFTPGPLTMLVVGETLKHGRKEGFKIAFAPIISDIPIVGLTFLLLSSFSQIKAFLGVISILGGFYLIYLGYDSLRFKKIDLEKEKKVPQSLKKGIFINLLNPSPYIFWFTVGAPTAIQASQKNWIFLAVFFLGFYLMLVGSKIGLAWLTEKTKSFISSKFYSRIMRILGLVLIIFAIIFFAEGIRLLRI